MGIISTIFGTREQRVFKTCKKIYDDAKRKRPDRNERDYLKIILITKPPFDYQSDKMLDGILDSCRSVKDLSCEISNLGKLNSLWNSRERNIKMGFLENRNRKFFSEFWDF